MFEIRLGIPKMQKFWFDLCEKVSNNFANKDEIKLHKKMLKCFRLLANNPFHNSLNTHEISVLSSRYGMKVWQSYLENNKPAAGRLYWVYYPDGSITLADGTTYFIDGTILSPGGIRMDENGQIIEIDTVEELERVRKNYER